MLRVKILKSNKHGKIGEIITLDRNEAFGLIDSGQAEVTKDMTPDDYKQAGDNDGKLTRLRPNYTRRR